MTINKQSSHYESFGPSWYDRHWSSNEAKISPCHLWVARHVRTPLLDVGGGPGLLLDLMEDVTGMIAVDFSPVAVEQCRGKGYEAVVASAESLPFPDASFRTVVAIETLEHVDDLDAAIAELHRVASEQVIITVPPNMASISHKWVWSIEQWREALGLGKPDFYDGIHAGWILSADPHGKAHHGKILLEYNPNQRGTRPYSAAHIKCKTGRRGLEIQCPAATPSSAHVLLTKGTAARVEPQHGIPTDPNAYFICRITAQMSSGLTARIFVIWYDHQGVRRSQNLVATLQSDVPTIAFSFAGSASASHFALAITPASRPTISEITIESIMLRSVQVDKPFRMMLKRANDFGKG